MTIGHFLFFFVVVAGFCIGMDILDTRKDLKDYENQCSALNGVLLKDMNAKFFCISDGKIYPLKESE